MSKSWNNGARAVWYRRLHRWLGLTTLVFVVLLSVTGIALNHVEAWRLDERYVRWPWLLDAYGIEAPPVAASFADGGHRATLMGGRLYLDDAELARDVEALAGIVATGNFVVIAAGELFVLTPHGELVERIEPQTASGRSLDALGIADGRVVAQSDGRLFRFDEALLNVESSGPAKDGNIRWSVESPAPAEMLERLREHFVGRGLPVARILADLHSGRIVTQVGRLIMDAIAVLLIVLSLIGFLVWRSRGGNGGRTPPRPR